MKDYHFEIPKELIAQTPVTPRDHSRLMVVDQASGQIEHAHFYDLPRFLSAGDLLVSNNSQVIRARLRAHRLPGGGKVEIFLLKPVDSQSHQWSALYRSSKSAGPGIEFEVQKSWGALKGEVLRVDPETRGGVFVQFDQDPIAKQWGEIPLPPYIESTEASQAYYKTVYEKQLGSVAAPTAGFHFTQELLERLKQTNVCWEELTLHVGLGTFQPVQAKDIREHQMHEETFEIPSSLAEHWQKTREAGKKVVAVGTTSLRALESAYDFQKQKIVSMFDHTQIYLYPGKPVHSIDGLITNFHLPDSTLILLVSAVAGKELIQKAYQEAIKEKYRFYSFGDAMLILRGDSKKNVAG